MTDFSKLQPRDSGHLRKHGAATKLSSLMTNDPIAMLLCRIEAAAGQKYLRNHGFNSTPNTAWWTPEEAWLEK